MTHALITVNGQQVWATDSETQAIRTLEETRKGGVASVKGYRPSTNWISAPVQNIQFLSRVSTMKLYARRKAALEALSFADIADAVNADPVLAAKSTAELRKIFFDRLQKEIDSIQQTEDGDRSDAHRQGHDRCYIKITEGVKVNLVTEKGDDGRKHPVLNNGYPVVASIMISALFLNVKTVQEGERKVVNSGAPVRMSNIIARVLNKPGLSLKMLSLKADNFDSLNIDNEAILAEELHDLAA